MSQVFKALADPSRRKILTLLKQRDLTVSQIQKKFTFTSASLSHHLDILKRANLVIAEREGRFIRYSLNLSAFEEATQLLFNLFKK